MEQLWKLGPHPNSQPRGRRIRDTRLTRVHELAHSRHEMEDDTMSSGTSNLLNTVIRTSGFSWDSARPWTFPCRTRSQAAGVPRLLHTWKVNCRLCSLVRDRELGPAGHILSLLGNHWPLWKWSQAILGHLSTAVIWTAHAAPRCHQLHARLWRQTDDQLETVSACSTHWHGTQTKLPRRRSPELCWMHAQWHYFPKGRF